MKVSKQEYKQMYKNASAKSKSWFNIPKAFVIGGLICCIGQFFLNLFKNYDMSKVEAGSWTSIILIGISAILTGFGLYEKIAKHGGAGTLVPITGFANAVVAPALEFKSEGYVLGVGAKIFIVSGPVILYGLAASVLYGIIYWITQMF